MAIQALGQAVRALGAFRTTAQAVIAKHRGQKTLAGLRYDNIAGDTALAQPQGGPAPAQQNSLRREGSTKAGALVVQIGRERQLCHQVGVLPLERTNAQVLNGRNGRLEPGEKRLRVIALLRLGQWQTRMRYTGFTHVHAQRSTKSPMLCSATGLWRPPRIPR